MLTGTVARPSRATIAASKGGTIPDVIAADLDVLFVGVNPSLYSAAVGHHFARPGNRFWPTLHRCGMTPRQLRPEEDVLLPEFGGGLTNLVARATARADEVDDHELVAGARTLLRKVGRYTPRIVAVVGVTAYRVAFAERRAELGRQPRDLVGAKLWVLPNPSGLNAHYQLPALAQLYAEMLADD